MEEEFRAEMTVRTGVCKIQSFVGIHCDEHLDKGEDSLRKHALMGVFLYLVARLAYGHAGLL